MEQSGLLGRALCTAYDHDYSSYDHESLKLGHMHAHAHVYMYSGRACAACLIKHIALCTRPAPSISSRAEAPRAP